MGNFASCGLGFPGVYSPSSAMHVVKLVHSNGLVDEFYRPVRVGELTVDYPNHLICHSHDLLIAAGGYGDLEISNNRSVPPPCLSDDDDMELGQIYFLLPRKIFDSPLTSADIAAIVAKAAVARKASYKHLHASIKQLAPLPLPSMLLFHSDQDRHLSPSPVAQSPKSLAMAKSQNNDRPGNENDNKPWKSVDVAKTQSHNRHGDEESHCRDEDDAKKVALSKEFVRKLLAETRMKLQSASTASPVPVVKHVSMIPELETAYTRHILARSYHKLWRPPLDTIMEDSSNSAALI